MKNKPKLSIICALDKNRGIGKNNKLLTHLPKDLAHFKRVTSGYPVVMGLNTYKSIGRPLPSRLNIVLSRDKDLKIKDIKVAHNIDDSISIASLENPKEIFVIGGASIYQQFIDRVDRLYLTIIDKTFDADTFFPDYSMFKKTVSEETDLDQGLALTYLVLER